MKYKDFVKSTEEIFEAIIRNAGTFSQSLFKLQERIEKLENENKMLREHLNVEIVEEKVEGGYTKKFIRKIK